MLKRTGIIISLLAYLFVFLANLYFPSDFDMGWHQKYGEYVVQNKKILHENTFSTELTGYRWVNSSWGLDVFRYLLYVSSGFWGYILMGGVMVALTFFFFSKASSFSFWDQAIIFPLMVFLQYPLNVHSFRGQQVSILGTGILYLLLIQYERGHRKRLLLTIPFFFLWANIHGQFVLGILIFLFYAFVRFFIDYIYTTIKEKKVYFHPYLLLAAIGSFIATLINPFGLSLYLETFTHTDTPAIFAITEWLPIPPFSTTWWYMILFGIVFGLGVYMCFRDKKHGELVPFFLIGAGLYFCSFWMGRFVWTMYYILLPFIFFATSYLKPKSLVLQVSLSAGAIISCLLYVLFVTLPKNHFNSTPSWTQYCNLTGCSIRGGAYLAQHHWKGKLLTDYNMGGFLIWNFPSVKPSMDGRMSLWVDEKGYSAFIPYYRLEQGVDDPNLSQFDTIFMERHRALNQRMVSLVQNKLWKVVYYDNFAIIYERIGDPSPLTNPIQ